jgi:hypothetical protein
MKDPKRQAVVDHYNKASQFASEFVEQEARKILVEHPELDEFVMAMGTWFFKWKIGATDNQGIVIEEWMDQNVQEGSVPFIKESVLAEFIANWDEYLKITGEPMRFTATGPVVRNW